MSKNGVKEDFYGVWEIYEVNVVEIVKPELYYLIQKIICGDVAALQELFSKKITLRKENLDLKNIDYYFDSFQHMFGITLMGKININLYNMIQEFIDKNEVHDENVINLVLNRSKIC